MTEKNALHDKVSTTIEGYRYGYVNTGSLATASGVFLSTNAFEKRVTAFAPEILSDLSNIQSGKTYRFASNEEEMPISDISNKLSDIAKLKLEWNWTAGNAANTAGAVETADLRIIFTRTSLMDHTQTGTTVIFPNGYAGAGATSGSGFTTAVILDPITIPTLFTNFDFHNFIYTFRIETTAAVRTHFRITALNSSNAEVPIPTPTLSYRIIPTGEMQGESGEVSLYTL